MSMKRPLAAFVPLRLRAASKRLAHGLAIAAALAGLCGADWPQFRGVEATGQASAVGPQKLDKIAWTVSLPGRGLSGPIVVGDRVYVTCCSGYQQDRLHVLAVGQGNGSVVWDRQFWATGRTQCHPSMSVASCTPASDGQRLVALFSSNDLACLDRDGRLLWFRGLNYDFPNASNSLGMASSPLIVDGTVICQLETDDESFATGLDVVTGRQRWKIDRPRNANWTTPVIVRGPRPAEDLVVLQSANGLNAVHPKTGETAWKYDDGAATIPSSALGEGMIFVPSHGLTALAIEPTSRDAPVRWRKTQISPATPSPVYADGRIYTVTSASLLVAADAKSGDVAWRLRLKGSFTSSPIVAGDRLYLFNNEGLGTVVRLGAKKGEIVGEHPFAEGILCTPAVSNGAVFVRSDQHLWKVTD